MEYKLICNTVEEFMILSDCTVDEIKEWYGENVVRVYWIELYNDVAGVLIGVEFAEGTYAVYGCRRDTENLTYEQMIGMLEKEFGM